MGTDRRMMFDAVRRRRPVLRGAVHGPSDHRAGGAMALT